MRINKHVVITALALFLLFSFKLYDNFFEISKNLEIFNEVYKNLHSDYVDEVQPGTIIKKGIDAMLNELDPYTNFYSENEAERALIDRLGEYGGVGTRLRIRDGKAIVTEVLSGYAFNKADVRVADEITAINGVVLKNPTILDLSALLRGTENTIFDLTVLRGNVSINKSVKRVQIVSKSVPFYTKLNEETGYVELSEFGRGAATEIKQAIIEMDKKGVCKNIILDLRNNGGGLLNEAVDIVGIFAGKGVHVVDMKGKKIENNKRLLSTMEPVALDKKLCILINKKSASASEVVSGSIQDLDRGVIIGQTSFGKGLVQNYVQLPYRTQMKITTAKYYTPSGRCIQLLDYSKRREDGSVGSIADSLRTSFKTSKGRIVKDGGGVQPDVVMEEFGGVSLFNVLKANWTVFDFCSAYCKSKDSLSSYQFLTTLEVDKFITLAAERMSEDEIKEYKKHWENKIGKNEAIGQLNSLIGLKNGVTNFVTMELTKNRVAVKYLLENEILATYHQNRLIQIKKNLEDMEIKKALSLFESKEYSKILKL